MIKLTKYQVVLTVLFVIIYTATIQISAKSILENKVEHMPIDIHINSALALFWLNILTVLCGLILIIFQSLIYKIIVGVLGTKQKFSIGLNVFLFITSILPGAVITAVLTLLNNGISVSQNFLIIIFTILLSAGLYSVILWCFSIIDKSKIKLVFLIITILNALVSLFKLL
ncbi:hypothetical protein OXR01_08965 [Staphylococcus gallinarum]|uniref:hypothetical protein n=1 Tax=Staphylococcus gallinarum TaxID=1293 RepID=UPI00227FFD73|nr:hypothetical protein [Staphylococcus gallinarum]MDN6414070.1 hypothetical protein [Staphylococcus gallinarum]